MWRSLDVFLISYRLQDYLTSAPPCWFHLLKWCECGLFQQKAPRFWDNRTEPEPWCCLSESTKCKLNDAATIQSTACSKWMPEYMIIKTHSGCCVLPIALYRLNKLYWFTDPSSTKTVNVERERSSDWLHPSVSLMLRESQHQQPKVCPRGLVYLNNNDGVLLLTIKNFLETLFY